MVAERVFSRQNSQSKRCLPGDCHKDQQRWDVKGWRHRYRQDAARAWEVRRRAQGQPAVVWSTTGAPAYRQRRSVQRCMSRLYRYKVQP